MANIRFLVTFRFLRLTVIFFFKIFQNYWLFHQFLCEYLVLPIEFTFLTEKSSDEKLVERGFHIL